jgi:hypothetical protein
MAPDTTGGGSGEFTPGDVEYRVVNLLAEPVDLYVRTQGLVEAFLMEEGVAPGAVTDFYAPPADGIFLVTEAGAGDPECVVSCDHFIAELSPFSDDGPAHTVVLYDNFGQAASFDLWESPSEASSGNANAMAPADAAAGVVVVTAIALTEADFGLRLGHRRCGRVPGGVQPGQRAGGWQPDTRVHLRGRQRRHPALRQPGR